MKKLLFVLLLIPVLGWAQSPFDGTWKIDLSKAKFPKKPDEYLLKDGMYECKIVQARRSTSRPMDSSRRSAAIPIWTSMMVKVVDDKHVEICLAERRQGHRQGDSHACRTTATP